MPDLQPPPIAIVWHSRTGASQAIAEAVAQGAGAVGLLIAAQQTEPEILAKASAFVFVCPENLGTMSGAMKEMFDRCYYPLLDKMAGRAYATAIAAGSVAASSNGARSSSIGPRYSLRFNSAAAVRRIAFNRGLRGKSDVPGWHAGR